MKTSFIDWLKTRDPEFVSEGFISHVSGNKHLKNLAKGLAVSSSLNTVTPPEISNINEPVPIEVPYENEKNEKNDHDLELFAHYVNEKLNERTRLEKLANKLAYSRPFAKGLMYTIYKIFLKLTNGSKILNSRSYSLAKMALDKTERLSSKEVPHGGSWENPIPGYEVPANFGDAMVDIKSSSDRMNNLEEVPWKKVLKQPKLIDRSIYRHKHQHRGSI